jgi:hypothetical protein
MKKEKRVLFILKKRQSSHPNYSSISSGLLNSANFVNDMLNKNGITSYLVEVIDNNGIDKEVTEYKPTHVIIEALWVVPSKFEVLTKLHPNVKWIIRLHSDISFLSNEGMAIEWIYDYLKYPNISISTNDLDTKEALSTLTDSNFVYLPNYYPVGLFNSRKKKPSCKKTLNVGCFGAIRPLKNQLIQAVTAINYADAYDLKLRFHINVTRIEGKGEPALKNIRQLFENNLRHELVEHEWLNHIEFIRLVKSMDFGMQVSFTETFNIVTADFVNNNVPIVASDEISWVSCLFQADPAESKSIFNKMRTAINLSGLKFLNKIGLWFYCLKSERIWTKYFG